MSQDIQKPEPRRRSSIVKKIKDAAGPRRYIIGALFTFTIAAFDWLRPFFANLGMTEIIGITSWAAGIIVGLCFVLYWFVDYSHKLRKQIQEARIDLSKLRAAG